MNNHWSHQSPSADQNPEQKGPTRTGGLLSTYARQQQINQHSPVSRPVENNSYSPMSSGPSQPSMRRAAPVQPGSPQSLNQFKPNTLFSNTMQAVRSWSGKMASVAGYTYQPPAPPMERYHPTLPTADSMFPQTRSRRWRRSRTLRITTRMRHRRERWESTQPTGKNIWTKLLLACAIALMVVSFSSTAYGFGYYQSQLPRLQEIAHQTISQTTRIYDRNNTLLYTAYNSAGRRTPVSYNDIPQVMQDAMIAAEDNNFWTNAGVDLTGILRAGLGFVQKSAVQGGGSTLTQQVIKNLTGNEQVTLSRKIPEAALAIGLTEQYPKWKILEMYLNVASFGAQDQGVEAAAQEYFKLTPNCDQHFKCIPAISQLDLNQANQHDPILGLARASLLAGMVQNPVGYDPTGGEANRQRALERQKYVLDRMMTLGQSANGKLITPAMAKQAENLTAQMTFTKFQNNKVCPHFVDWVIEQFARSLGHGDYTAGYHAFITGGFNIRTTIDANLEKYVEDAVTRHLTKPEYQLYTGGWGPLNVRNNVNDAAVVVMNTHTGEILAMDGSSDYNSTDPKINGNYNVASPPYGETGRAPGSSFKPIIYSTAFQMGWYPGMVLPDFKTYFPNGKPQGTRADKDNMYIPPDFSVSGDPEYHHNDPFTTVRVATANSYNVPAIKAMEFAGGENVLTTAQRLGITTLQNNGDSWGIGSENVPLLQMTGAYQAFANGGERVAPQGILDIWDNYGHTLYHYDPANPPRSLAISPQVAYLMTSVLMDEPDRRIEFPGDHDLSFTDKDYTCSYMIACGHQVAAKTGTTDQYRDNLTIGYTPGVVVGVWAGNADNSPMEGVTGITGAAPIWHSVMEFAAKGWCNQATDLVACPQVDRASLHIDESDTFPIPPGVHQAPTSSFNGLQGGGNFDWMIDGQQPLQSGPVPPAPQKNNDQNNKH